MKRSINLLASLIFFSIIFSFFSFQNISAQVQVTPEYDEDSVLVKFKPGLARSEKADIRSNANSQLEYGYRIVPGLEKLKVNIPVEKAIEILDKNPNVEYVEPNYFVTIDSTVPNDEYFNKLWGLQNTGQLGGTQDSDIDATEAWDISTGDTNTVVAIIDTGIDYTHPDLVNNMWTNEGEVPNNNIDDDGNGIVDDYYGASFCNDGQVTGDPMDTYSHGTHVAGTVCASGNNNIGVTGVVWNCKLMALRFLCNPYGLTSDAIRAIEYAVDNGVRISNNSWGTAGYTISLVNAINNAAEIGHVFIAAAGNNSEDSDEDQVYPASYSLDNIISVAALNPDDTLASFSNYGLISVDLGAPGYGIYSTKPNNSYGYLSGTSMAAPHVTGVVALVLGLNPEWSYNQVIDQVLSTTRPVDSLQGITVTGGVVNAFNAINEISSAPPPPSVPAKPGNLFAFADDLNSSIEISWDDNSDNENSFILERDENGSGVWGEIATIPANEILHVDSGLLEGVEYCYRVKARNLDGDSDYSNIDCAILAVSEPDPAPGSPDGLSANGVSTTEVQVNWNDNSNNEDGFEIESSLNGNSWSVIDILSPNSSSYTDQGLDPDTTYYYKVSAFNASGYSDYSNTDTGTTLPVESPYIDLNVTTYKIKGDKFVDLTWTGVQSGSVDIFKNNKKLSTTNNSGGYTDSVPKGKPSTYVYEVCESSSETNCSNSVSIDF